MISVAEARARIVGAFAPLASETVSLADANGRVLASAIRARATQPPFAVSSMDGYALRAADAARVPCTLRVIGVAAAGKPFEGHAGAGEAVRIFTGGVMPSGADAIVIQEDTEIDGTHVTVKEAASAGRYIRPAGLDFAQGDVLAPSGKRLSPRDLALIAAGDHAQVDVRCKPRVAFAATGDELSLPGTPRRPGGIVASSGFSLAACIAAWGGEPRDLGILPDTEEAFAILPDAACDTDLIVTLGGASVGDHDLVQKALGPHGFAADFWRIAMRPGKPLLFGRLGNTPLLGLPGNPVSSFVCGFLFLRPALAAMLGTEFREPVLHAHLATALPQNDAREDYLRAALEWRGGEPWVHPFPRQDSSMQRILAEADVLIRRPPHAPGAVEGEPVEALWLDA